MYSSFKTNQVYFIHTREGVKLLVSKERTKDQIRFWDLDISKNVWCKIYHSGNENANYEGHYLTSYKDF